MAHRLGGPATTALRTCNKQILLWGDPCFKGRGKELTFPIGTNGHKHNQLTSIPGMDMPIYRYNYLHRVNIHIRRRHLLAKILYLFKSV